MKNKGRIRKQNHLLNRYYFITGSSGCPSAEYMYMSKKVTEGVMPGSRESSANEYPRDN